jgi:hypothetical protein
MTRLACLALTGVLGVIACDAEDTGPPPSESAELLVGGALADGTGFVDLDDGADAELVPGAQGGFHVWINVRVLGAAGPLRIAREARRLSDGALVLAGSRHRIEVPSEAMQTWWTSPVAAASFMCPSPVGITVFDDEMEFTVRLEDDEGTEIARDRLVVVPRCPADKAGFCVSICSG